MSRQQVYLVSTGDDEKKLDRLEQRFSYHLDSHVDLRLLRLGNIDSHVAAYTNVASFVDDPNAILIFAHQDAFPAFQQGLESQLFAQTLPDKQKQILNPALMAPNLWVEMMLKLAQDPTTGWLGVVGSCSLESGVAWWNHSELSGTVIHESSINVYGPWGRVAVVDGVCMIIRAGTLREIEQPLSDPKSFHFYDMTYSLLAHSSGRKNWTIPLLLMHESGGAPLDDAQWQNDMARFLGKYGDRLPITVPFEPLV